MNLSNGIRSSSNSKFNNQRIIFIEFYLMNYISEDDKTCLHTSKSIKDKPINLFTSEFILINYIATIKQSLNGNEK